MTGTRTDYRVFRTLPTRWFDNDIYGHLNNTVHYQLFDTAVNAHLMDAAVLDPAGGETVFLVIESGCRYHAPLAFPQTVTAGLRVAHLGTSAVRYEIGLFGGDEDTAAAEGFFVHVNVDRIKRTKAPIPDATRDVLNALRPA
ncbi:Thioesterase superfamily protein [Rhodobacteraceae bacterium THAF1]|uniref:acyl-CoA thioesterase n=1 Tax=Palleronia sp. THAF1 TaxID=2587842 RepID=UPI000F41ECF7|nr:thioesterase family protein [Palleronia sp. THAF1]QFU07688.1 Thioesterase superfamily protein [Palleronia sp. THAF1]VDC23144.1 Thioesterase superfamily protein [Rhodobacteraceae bacterium THAF1]